MQYKTMVLGLLQQHPEIYHHLRSQHLLLPALEVYAMALRTNHEAWKDRLMQANPGSNQSQIASEALEVVLKELETCLHAKLPSGESELHSIEAAMALISGRTELA